MRRLGLAILGVAVLLTSRYAAANGRYPASNQIVFSANASSSVPDVLVVRATYGLLVSRDGAATWQWLCEGALGVPAVSIEDPSIALTASQALVVGLVEGLDVSADLGCRFDCAAAPPAGTSIVDLVVRPDAPDTVLALSSSYVFGEGGTTGGAATLDTRIFESTDDGAHWTQLGVPLDPSVVVTTIDVAKSDPQRIYVSGTRGFGETRSASLFVSSDAGMSWTERPMPFDPTREVAVFIGAVDPSSPDRVYVRSSGQSRLFVTSDGGKSFAIPLTLQGQMLGLALAPDGSKVYAGSEEDGLFVGKATAGAAGGDAGFTFEKTSSVHVQCLATHGSELWACSDEASGFLVGASMDDGAHFSPRLQSSRITGSVACAADVGGPFACGADANASLCAGAAFEAVCSTLGGCGLEGGAGDAGANEVEADDAGPRGSGAAGAAGAAGADAGTVSGPATASSCGFSTSAGGGAAGIAASCALVAVALRRRRRVKTP